jgi:hypothetical protein
VAISARRHVRITAAKLKVKPTPDSLYAGPCRRQVARDWEIGA